MSPSRFNAAMCCSLGLATTPSLYLVARAASVGRASGYIDEAGTWKWLLGEPVQLFGIAAGQEACSATVRLSEPPWAWRWAS